MADPTRQSCHDCPSFLTSADTIRTFGKSAGVPMCGRFGHVLGTTDMTANEMKKVAEKTAEGCGDFGRPRPATPSSASFAVMIADPDSLTELGDLDPRKTLVTNCAMCKNFIPDDKVQETWGFTAGACTAKGKLILSNRKSDEARACRYRQHGEVRRDVTGLQLIPILNRAVAAGVPASVGGLTRDADSIIEPSLYPTDKEVSDDEKADGIRAWRKLVDPEGSGNFVYMPVFDEESFSKEERAKIPQTGDDERPELYLDHNGSVYKIMVLWRELDETPMLWGEPGVGKTEIFRHIAWLMRLPFERFSITRSSSIDDLAGTMLYSKERGTYFHAGRITQAWGKRCIMCIDEPNTGPPEVWEFIRPMTDNSKQLVVDQSDDPTPLERHVFCHFGMAGNPAWNALNVGTEVIADADASRLMHLYFDLPEENVERAIISNRVRCDGWEIDNVRLGFIMKVAEQVRDLCKSGTLSMSWGIRPQLKVARALRWFPPKTAYRMAVADMLEPPQQAALLDQVASHEVEFPKIHLIEK